MVVAASTPLVLTVLGNHQDTGSGNSYTGMSFGTATSDRYIVLAFGCVGNDITAVTIGGVSASKLVSVVAGFGSVRTSIWIAAVPTGTSGDVVLTGISGVSSAQLYGITGLNSASATDTGSNSGSSPLNFSSLSVSAGGVAIGTSFSESTPGATATWTGLTTVDLNVRFNAAASQHSAAHYSATADVSLSGSVSMTTGNAFSMVVASLR
jgi:hypothetical protein